MWTDHHNIDCNVQSIVKGFQSMDHRLYNVLNNLGNPVINNKTQNLRHLHKRKENKKNTLRQHF